MNIIHDWKFIAARAHSMWAFYLSLIALLLPDAIYWAFETDTNPRLWFWIGVALLIYGIVGRLLDQGVDQRKIRSPALLSAAVVALAMSQAPPAPEVPPAAPVGVATPAAFSAIAVPHVGRWEGLRLTAYLDRIARPPVWTVCYGETKGVKPGDTFTKAQCDAMLADEVLAYRVGLHAYFNADTKAQRLPAARDVAYVSLAYNAGIRAIGKSTATRRLNAGDIAGGCDALTWWNKAGGRVIRGLVNRRTDELALCLAGL